MVVVVAVCVVPVVILIVFIVVGVQVMKGKAVMTVEEIDGSVVAALTLGVKVRRTGYAVGSSLNGSRIAL